MKFLKFAFAVLLNLFMAVAIGGAFSAYAGEPSLLIPSSAVVFTGGLAMSLAPAPGGVAFMAVQVELWQDTIRDHLYKDNQFLLKAFNADQYVMAGKVVHIPVAGAKPTIVKNRSSYPATITRRTDSDVTYALDQFTADPQHIENADTIELSYDKRASILENQMEGLRELIAEEMLYHWQRSTGGATETAQILRTTGAATAAHTGSGTGNRKLFVKEDLLKARILMNKNNISTQGRVALVDSDMMAQLMDDEDLKRRDSSLELDIKNGIVTRLYGFDLMERSTTSVYSNAGTPVIKAVGAAGAAADNSAVICWHPSCVERAVGDIKFFEEIGKVDYYGDVYSSLVRMGGRIRRPEGVVAIVQDAAA